MPIIQMAPTATRETIGPTATSASAGRIMSPTALATRPVTMMMARATTSFGMKATRSSSASEMSFGPKALSESLSTSSMISM